MSPRDHNAQYMRSPQFAKRSKQSKKSELQKFEEKVESFLHKVFKTLRIWHKK